MATKKVLWFMAVLWVGGLATSCSKENAADSAEEAGQAGSAGAGGQAAAGAGGQAAAGAGGQAGAGLKISADTREELIASYLEVFCNAYRPCCESAGKSSKPCKDRLRKEIPASGEYQPDLGKKCLDNLAIKTKLADLCSPGNDGSDEYNTEIWRFDQTCARAFGAQTSVSNPLSTLGEPCSGVFTQSGASFLPNEDKNLGLCDRRLGHWCSPDSHTCEATSAGGPCTPPDEGSCPPEFLCSKEGTCQPKGALGATCTQSSPCQTPFFCAEGVCEARVATSGPCSNQCKLACTCPPVGCSEPFCGSQLCE